MNLGKIRELWERWRVGWAMFWYGPCQKCGGPILPPRLWWRRGWCDACGEAHWQSLLTREERARADQFRRYA